MDRQTTFTQALGRSTDFLQAQQNTMAALGWAVQAALGVGTAVDGFTLTPTTPASLVANLTPGAIYQVESLEATTWSSLPVNTASIVKQGLMQAVDPITFVPPSTTGYSQCFLIEAQYADLDTTPVLLPYYNASNPLQPYQGPNNSGVSQSTQRLGIASIQVKAGVAAPSGSQTVPTPDAGWVGLFVVTLAAGATQITGGNIATYAGAPFIPVKLPGVPAGVQSGQWVYGSAAGTNTYTATLYSTAASPYARSVGMEILVYFANANTTTTPTLAENGQAAAQIRKQGGAAPAAGDITGFVPLVWDGTYWRINGLAVSDILALIPANGGIISVVDTGNASTANALVGTAQPGISAYAARQVFLVTASAAANTATNPTLNVTSSGGTPLGALTIVRSDGSAVAAGDIPANATFLAEADGAGHARFLSLRPSDVTTAVAAVYAVRIRLTANLNLYVATTGSDTANTGLTSGSPFATLQKAYNYLQQTYDLSGYTATINVAAGTYGAGVVAANPVAGQTSAGSVVFNGNTSNPASVYINVAGSSCFSAFAGANFAVQGFQVGASGSGQGQGSGLYAQGGNIIASNVFFSNFTQYQMFAQLGSVTLYGPITLNGSAMSAFQAQGYGTVNINSYAVTFGGGTYATAIANAVGGFISAGGTAISGTAGGQRYRSVNSGNIQTNGGGANFFPGTSAGSTDTTSSYG